MTTVSADAVRVESELAAGALSCPGCGGRLAPWGWARERPVGRGRDRCRVRPRRSICRACGRTHVLLAMVMLLRRGDFAELIGRALELRAAGLGQRPIAARVAVSRSTVRGGCRGSPRWPSRFGRIWCGGRCGSIRDWSGSSRLAAASVTRSRRLPWRAARPPTGSGSAAGGRSHPRRPGAGCCATRPRPSRGRGWAERSSRHPR